MALRYIYSINLHAMELRITQQELKEWSKICAPFIASILAVILGLWAGGILKPQSLPQPTPINFAFTAPEIQENLVVLQRPRHAADLFRLKKDIPNAPEPPSLPEEKQPIATMELHLQFIIFNNEKKLCKINDQFFEEGQEGNGFRIKKITRTGVWIEPIAVSGEAVTSGQSYFVYIGQKINVTTTPF